MAEWNITVRVDYNFDVEAETQEEAEKIAWNEYQKRGTDVQIVEIWTDEADQDEDEDEDEDNEPDGSWMDEDALSSAGHGTDEDYGYYGDE